MSAAGNKRLSMVIISLQNLITLATGTVPLANFFTHHLWTYHFGLPISSARVIKDVPNTVFCG